MNEFGISGSCITRAFGPGGPNLMAVGKLFDGAFV
jgi:hypothetical protein